MAPREQLVMFWSCNKPGKSMILKCNETWSHYVTGPLACRWVFTQPWWTKAKHSSTGTSPAFDCSMPINKPTYNPFWNTWLKMTMNNDSVLVIKQEFFLIRLCMPSRGSLDWAKRIHICMQLKECIIWDTEWTPKGCDHIGTWFQRSQGFDERSLKVHSNLDNVNRWRKKEGWL